MKIELPDGRMIPQKGDSGGADAVRENLLLQKATEAQSKKVKRRAQRNLKNIRVRQKRKDKKMIGQMRDAVKKFTAEPSAPAKVMDLRSADPRAQDRLGLQSTRLSSFVNTNRLG